MSINIMDLVKGAVSDQVMGQLGGLLGQNDRQKTSSVFESATASILGGLMKKGQTQQGTKQIFEAASNADDSILDRLGDLLGGGDQTQQVQQQGSGVMDMVFGNQQGGIITMLSRALGLDKTMIGKLLTMAAPILMGVIGRQVKSKGLDMVGFGSLLSSQKDHLGDYLPKGMGSELGLGDFSNVKPTAPVAPAATSAPSGGGSIAKILIPLLLLGALAYGVMQMMGHDNGAQEALDEEIPELNIGGDLEFDQDGPLAGAMDLGAGIDFGSLGESGEKLQTLKGKFTGIADGFKGLTGEDGANALKGKIDDLSGSVGDLGLQNFSGVAKTSASTMIGQFTNMISGLVDKIDNPMIKGIVKPAVDGLVAKFQSLGL